MWRDWYTCSRQDRRATLLLLVLIAIALVLLWTTPTWRREEPYETCVPDSLLQTLGKKPLRDDVVEVALRPFDPNSADSLELLSVGLPPFVVRNILRYRKAGGEFRRPDDLARIYGLHDTVFARVRPYVTIPAAERSGSEVQRDETVLPSMPPSREAIRREHPYAEYMRAKYKPGKVVDLNTADTAELMRIPGIGPVRARRIVEYRQALGGYHSIRQVHEAYDLPEELGDWVHISVPVVKKLHINRLSLAHLRSHPYLTFHQARAIVELRKREGDIRSVRQLLFLDEFSDADIERLAPYLSFE